MFLEVPLVQRRRPIIIIHFPNIYNFFLLFLFRGLVIDTARRQEGRVVYLLVVVVVDLLIELRPFVFTFKAHRIIYWYVTITNVADARLVPDRLARLPLVPVGLALVRVPEPLPPTARLAITTNLLVPSFSTIIFKFLHMFFIFFLHSQLFPLAQVVDHELARLLRESFLRPRLGELDALSRDPGRLIRIIELVDGRADHERGEPRVAAPVPLIQVVTVLHRVQHQHLPLQILIPFGRDNVLVDLDLDVGPDRQPQFFVALHLLDNSLAPDPGLEGRPVPLPQI
mmetsp:Transcript_24598/g.69208  ORF Transcript_24598/g.69208 Transcript_24598/m.69208 type:complete len:284 (+) Transcript_24598:373-1224(+)